MSNSVAEAKLCKLDKQVDFKGRAGILGIKDCPGNTLRTPDTVVGSVRLH